MRFQHLLAFPFLVLGQAARLLGQVLLQTEGFLTLFPDDMFGSAVRQNIAGLDIVPEAGVQNGFQAARQLPVGDGHHKLHPFIQIPGHPVRAGDEKLVVAAVVEKENARVLQIPVHNTDHADYLAVGPGARFQAANAAHVQFNVHPGVRGPVQGVNDFHVLEAVHLGGNAGGFPLPRAFRFPFNKFNKARLHQHRGGIQLAEAHELGAPRHGIEELGSVRSQLVVAGKVGNIRVNLGSGLIVVPRAEMAVTPQHALFPAHHQANLGMGLQPLDAVNNLHAGTLKLLRLFQIAGFVKTGFQLHQRRHLLAALRRFFQGGHDAGVPGGAVQHLLDGDDVRIFRGFLHQAQDGFKTFIGMVEQNVPAGNVFKNADGRVHGRGRLRGPLLHLQLVIAGGKSHFHEVGKHQGALEVISLLLPGAYNPHDLVMQGGGRGGLYFQPHAFGKFPGYEHFLHLIRQVQGVFLLHGNVPIARDAEHRCGKNGLTGKNGADALPDQVLQHHVALRLRGRDGNAPRQAVRKGHHGGAHLPGLIVAQFHAHQQLEGRQRGSLRRIHVQRRQKREYLVVEILLQRQFLGSAEILHRQGIDAVDFHPRQNFLMEQAVLVLNHAAHAGADGFQLAGGRQPGNVLHAGTGMPQHLKAAHAHHEKLIQVGGGNSQKLQAFQKGKIRPYGLVQHTLVEFQPGKFSVDIFVRHGKNGKWKFFKSAYRWGASTTSYPKISANRSPFSRRARSSTAVSRTP